MFPDPQEVTLHPGAFEALSSLESWVEEIRPGFFLIEDSKLVIHRSLFILLNKCDNNGLALSSNSSIQLHQ